MLGEVLPTPVPKGVHWENQGITGATDGLSVSCARAAGPIVNVIVALRKTLAGWLHVGQRVLGCDLWHLHSVPNFATLAE